MAKPARVEVPQELLAHVGNGLEGYYGVRLVGSSVVWSLGWDEATDPTVQVTPTPEMWEAFSAAIENAGLFDWEAKYRDLSVLDGTYWGVTCRWGDRLVLSSGANAFPAGFDAFCAAVSQLVGGRRFA